MHHLGTHETRERRAGDDRGEHDEHHERPEARREDVIARDCDEVGGENRKRADVRLRVRDADDREPGDRGEEGLERLEEEPEDDVLGVDGSERVPQRGEPALDVDAEEVEDRERECRRGEAGGGPRDARGQSSTQRRKPPRNASSLRPRRQCGGSSWSARALPPPTTT